MITRSPLNMAIWNAGGLVANNGTVTLSVPAFDLALDKAREQVAAAHRDNWHGLFCTIMNAWPNAEDADSSPQGIVGLIEQLTRERDRAVEALREVVTARPGWREAARIALAAVDDPS